MKRTPLQWLVAYAAIPATMALITAAFVLWQHAREVDGWKYWIIANAYPTLHAPAQARVKEAMRGGKLSEAQFDSLELAIINDQGMITSPPPGHAGMDSNQERQKLSILLHGGDHQ